MLQVGMDGHLIFGPTETTLVGSDVFPSLHHSGSSFSPGSNGGSDLCLMEKIAKFRVLPLIASFFVNRAYKMKDLLCSYRIPCAILYFCVLRLGKALRCLS